MKWKSEKELEVEEWFSWIRSVCRVYARVFLEAICLLEEVPVRARAPLADLVVAVQLVFLHQFVSYAASVRPSSFGAAGDIARVPSNPLHHLGEEME